MAAGSVHSLNLETATTLSAYQIKNAVAPLDVIYALNRDITGFVLVGTYGLVGWMPEPRATQTVDVLTPLRSHIQAVDALLRAFPQLEAHRRKAATHLRHRGTHEVAIRLLKPLDRLYRETRKRTHSVHAECCDFKIPSLEMALLLTYGPMMALPWRAEKYLNAHDFICIARVNPEVDMTRLAAIADRVCPDDRKDLLDRVKRVQAGKPLNL